jgi:hypothetical protein
MSPQLTAVLKERRKLFGRINPEQPYISRKPDARDILR